MTETFASTDELLDFAIGKELEANEFYVKLAERVDKDSMKKIFKDFAAEELKHKAKLEAVKHGKKLLPSQGKVQNLKIADYISEVVPEPDVTLDYQKALIIAMHREKASFKLYTDLAAITDDPELKQLLEGLANEEAKHKLHFEREYDQHVLTED